VAETNQMPVVLIIGCIANCLSRMIPLF